MSGQIPTVGRKDGVTSFRSSYVRTVGRTAAFNALTAAVGAVTGVLIARLLGPAGRGDYAAVMSLFGMSLVVFEVGLAAAIVYGTARTPERSGTFVATSSAVLAPLSLLASGFLAISAVTFFGHSGERTMALLVAASFVWAAMMGAPATFTLQALDIQKWNFVRLAQPVMFVALILGTLFLGKPKVPVVIALYGATIVFQSALAWWLRRSFPSSPMRVSAAAARSMLKYGAANLASTIPNSLNGRLDQIVLAVMVPSVVLGQYAVAVSLSLLVSPLAVAFGNVAFPSLAGGSPSSKTVTRALQGSYAVGVAGGALVLGLSPLLVPLLYGAGFEQVPRLLLILAPGSVFFVVNQVLGDLLRGYGQPGRVALSEWSGAILTIVGLILLVPRFEAMGAAITSTTAYVFVHAMLLIFLRRSRATGGAHAARGPEPVPVSKEA